MPVKTKWQAIAEAKCPQCREGNMFVHSGYKLGNFMFMTMHKKCPSCGLKYEVEPGFFYGAMYISYAFSIAIFVICGVTTYILGNNPDAWIYISVLTVTLILASPFSFRYARVLMLHLFSGVRYKPKHH